MNAMGRCALVITGGYYYDWIGGRPFYDWARAFARDHAEIFDVYVMSWKPRDAVPREIAADLRVVFRPNVGCDWGCYDDFVKFLRRANDGSDRLSYDRIVFCHDDIQVFNGSWPIDLTKHSFANPGFVVTSFYGDVLTRVPEVDQALNPDPYVKGFMSMAFCARSDDDFFERCPFVTLPGNDVKAVGNTGCALVSLNIWNTWGSRAIGWAGHQGDGGSRSLIGSVGCWKRARALRPFPGDCWPDFSNPLSFNCEQAISQGYLRRGSPVKR